MRKHAKEFSDVVRDLLIECVTEIKHVQIATLLEAVIGKTSQLYNDLEFLNLSDSNRVDKNQHQASVSRQIGKDPKITIEINRATKNETLILMKDFLNSQFRDNTQCCSGAV